jgi:hypothetical protein
MKKNLLLRQFCTPVRSGFSNQPRTNRCANYLISGTLYDRLRITLWSVRSFRASECFTVPKLEHADETSRRRQSKGQNLQPRLTRGLSPLTVPNYPGSLQPNTANHTNRAERYTSAPCSGACVFITAGPSTKLFTWDVASTFLCLTSRSRLNLDFFGDFFQKKDFFLATFRTGFYWITSKLPRAWAIDGDP